MDTDGFAIAVTHDGSGWNCSLLDEQALDDLDAVLTALRQVAASGAVVFALIAEEDEFFAVVRPVPGGARLLLSDATAALDYDLAADVLDLLDVPVPDDDDADDSDPWPEGDMAVLADFGVSEQEMQIIVDDDDLYPDEQLQLVADRCGFGIQFGALVDIDHDD